MDLATEKCPHCNGTGHQLKQRGIGTKLRRERLKSEKSLRSIAKKLKLSAPYLLDLEMGRRNWTEEKVEAYRKALK